ncbi:MAG TPA: AraC family transcriptional regulator [Candidatus Obscuribacterales bacterium]
MPDEWPALLSFTQGEPSTVEWPERCAPLTIKFTVNSAATHVLGGREIVVNPGSYLIINEGTPHVSRIDSMTSFGFGSVFLNREICSQVAASLRQTQERLLDGVQSVQPPRFVERLYPDDQVILPLVRRACISLYNQDDAQLDELLFLIAENLFSVLEQLRAEVSELRFAKESTKAEIYLRLSIARDFMLSNLGNKMRLTEIAEVAGFSPHHFLRVFRDVFGETPHQYLINARLERARSLLLSSKKSIIDISGELGFESASSFSLLYKRRFGASPALDRKGVEHSGESLPLSGYNMNRDLTINGDGNDGHGGSYSPS